MLRLTNEIFIEKAIKIHGDKYNYKLINYKNSKTIVEIICNKCNNIFKQTPYDHLTRKHGCPNCNKGIPKLTREEIIKRFIEIHGPDRYDYSQVIYTGFGDFVNIICNNCGRIFSQRVRNHLDGRGCPCNGGEKLTESEVKKRIIEIHGDKYNLDSLIYVNTITKVKIFCNKNKHYFEITPHNLFDGHGCICYKKGYAKSKKCTFWLKSYNNINIETEQMIIINGINYVVDGIDKINKIIYEFWGNYWHGNPRIYNKNDMNKKIGRTFGYLYNKTLNKISDIENAGYKLIQIWEDEFDKIFGNIYKSINNNT